MNPFEMTVLIVAIVAVAKVLKARFEAGRSVDGDRDADQGATAGAMADEIRRLRDRVAVLERIATDGEGPGRLEREIEALRLQTEHDR